MVDWGPLGTTPYPGEPGGTPADITGDPSGGLDDPTCILPESAVQLVEPDGTHVAWLAKATKWSYTRSKSGPGFGAAVLNRTDPLYDEADFPRQLRFFDRGVMRARALIERRPNVAVSRAEKASEDTTPGGPGPLALTARGRVDPLALTLKPKQGAVRFAYAHPDYDDAAWDPVVDVGDYERPIDWPGGGTNILGPSADHEFAPAGTYYLRAGSSFNNPTEQEVALVWAVDNVGHVFLDGVEIDALVSFDPNNFIRSHERRFILSAGDHFLAGSVFNQSTDEPGPGGNPGFLNVTIREVDSNGQLGDIITSTDTDWVCYEFLSARPPGTLRPGWTAGEIIGWLLDRWEDRSGVVVARSFTDTLDSDGATWPIILDFTATVGSIFDALQALSEAHCDLDWSPDSDEIHAWIKDTRGTVTAVELPTGYTDAAAGCITDLRHTSEPPLVTSALLEWRDGYVIVEDAADVPVERKIDVPLVNTEAAAEEIGAYVLETFGVERVQGTGSLHPRDDTQRPGVGFDVADTVDAPDRTLALVPQVIQSYTHTVDADGQIRWQVEWGDLMFDREERFNNWVKGIASGHLGGRTFQTSPYREEVMPASATRIRDPFVFHHLATDATGASDPFPVDDFLTIQAVTIQVPGGEGGTFDLYRGVGLIDTFTISAAVTDPVTERNLAHKVQPGQYLTIDSSDAVAYVVVVHVA